MSYNRHPPEVVPPNLQVVLAYLFYGAIVGFLVGLGIGAWIW